MEHVGTSAKKFPRLHGRRFLFNIGGTIDRGAEVAEVERRRRENRGADMGCADGVSPSPLGEGSGEGAVPPPRKLFDCGSQNGEF